VNVIRFRPPRITPAEGSGAASPWPHIRLDRALDFLVGDRLA
jgi:predicted YcjX-like family ATPase